MLRQLWNAPIVDCPPAIEAIDDLPTSLTSFSLLFISKNKNNNPPSGFVSRIREFVSPHFIEDAMPIENYRAFLELVIRRYGLGEADAVLEDAKKLQEKISKESNGGSSRIWHHGRNETTVTSARDVVYDKLDGFIDTLTKEKAQEWKYPPLDLGGHGPASGRTK